MSTKADRYMVGILFNTVVGEEMVKKGRFSNVKGEIVYKAEVREHRSSIRVGDSYLDIIWNTRHW